MFFLKKKKNIRYYTPYKKKLFTAFGPFLYANDRMRRIVNLAYLTVLSFYFHFNVTPISVQITKHQLAQGDTNILVMLNTPPQYHVQFLITRLILNIIFIRRTF